MKKDSDDKNAIKKEEREAKDRNNTNTVLYIYRYSIYSFIRFTSLFIIYCHRCMLYISMLDNSIYLNLLFFVSSLRFYRG